jgi:CelD/BcsL family acetyltransferase involved in cellulose biosynthesis
MESLRSRWELLEQQPGLTLFQSYQFNRCAAEWFAAREAPHVVVAESDSGLAIIPSVIRQKNGSHEREVALLGETLFDYRDVLSAGDPAVLASAWHELAREGLPLEVTALRGEAARERWQHLGPVDFCRAPMTRPADLSADQFEACHKKSAKAGRRLGREGLQLTCGTIGAYEAAEWLYRGKATWQGASENLFLDGQRRNFMYYLLQYAAGIWQLWRYVIDGQFCAALLTLDHRGIRHYYTIHFDQRWEHLSPGQVLIFDVTRESLAQGLDVDFMTGEYAYKNRLATAWVPLYRVRASARQMAAWPEQQEPMAA